MGKFKLNKKHLFYFPVMLVLLFSLNLNTFAATSHSVHLADTDYFCSYYNDDYTVDVDCTNDMDVASSTLTISDVPYPCTILTFPTAAYNYYKQFNTTAKLSLYTDTTYNFKCVFVVGSTKGYNAHCLIRLYFKNADGGPYYIDIKNRSDLLTGTFYYIDETIKIPDYDGNVSCFASIMFRSDTPSVSMGSGRFAITDFTITCEDPIITGTPINTPSTEELENTLQEYEDVMSALPQVDENELADLMNFDFDSFSDGMSFVREMFERTMTTFGFNAVLVFGLTVGLATYIIGRKVG